MKAIVSKILFVLGIVLIGLNLLSIVGILSNGGALPLPNFSSEFMISYSLAYCFGFYLFAIIGIVLIIVSRIVDSSKGDAKKLAKLAAENLANAGMLICPECGATIKDSSIFCPKCNTKITK